jgi:hypothetical protein
MSAAGDLDVIGGSPGMDRFEVDDLEGKDCLDHSCSCDESASRKSL